MTRKKVAVIGGGAAGASLLWCYTSQEHPRDQIEPTLFHDDPDLGGHSDTYFVKFDADGKGHVVPDMTPESHAIDIGVQFVTRTMYPNLYEMLERPEFDGIQKLELIQHPELRVASAFRDDLNWGNFPAYQTGPRFAPCYTPDAVAHAEKFEEDIRLVDLSWFMDWPVDKYLRRRGVPRDGNFFRYMLVSYLTIINGYGTDELLAMKKRDLFPVFSKLPIVQDRGPLASFTTTGKGWDRFKYGAQRWVEAMGEYAVERGAEVKTGVWVTKVVPRAEGTKVRIEWIATVDRGKPDAEVHSALFDEVVLTIDMDGNRKLLEHPDNPIWEQQDDYVGEDAWNLMPGLCLIHQDEEVLAPSLRDQKEDAHFNGYYAWNDDPQNNLYGLPFELDRTYTTYLMHNIVQTPAPCFVSMYAVDDHAKKPDPSKVIFEKRWKHGRWVSSHDMKTKRGLHQIQGLGNIWFAGNNTTVDSEEGALISAMAVAERTSGFDFDFGSVLSKVIYRYFEDIMFPPQHLSDYLGLTESFADEN